MEIQIRSRRKSNVRRHRRTCRRHRKFPYKYEQLVGERGITLSGGQKQRTAIARAVMRDPRILILDDSLSAVDTYTEEKILHGLRDVRADRTTLIVSHRVSTIRDADLICVLRRRTNHRTRNARRTRQTRRRICRSLRTPAFGRRTGSD